MISRKVRGHEPDDGGMPKSCGSPLQNTVIHLGAQSTTGTPLSNTDGFYVRYRLSPLTGSFLGTEARELSVY